MYQSIDCRKIGANDNYRNPLSEALKAEGWTVWAPKPIEPLPEGETAGIECQVIKALWPLATSEKAENRAKFVKLIEKHDPELVTLATTIRDRGQLQPVELFPAKTEGYYEMVFGERRALAVLLNWAKSFSGDEVMSSNPTPTIEARVLDSRPTEADRLERNLFSNIAKAANPVEKGEALALAKEHGNSVKQLSEMFGCGQESIRNYLKVAKLPETTKAKVASGQVPWTKAVGLVKDENGQVVSPEDKGPKAKAMRSRKDIIEARKEYETGNEGYRILSWVLGMRKKIDE